MTNPFIDVSTWAHDYLIETRVAMVSLWHQKATPVLHDVVAYVDANRMEVSLAVFLAAFVFLSCVLAFKWLKIRKELSSVEETVSLHKSDASFWHGCWNRVRDQKWAMHSRLESTHDALREAEEKVVWLSDQKEELEKRVEFLESEVLEREDDIAEKESMISDLEERLDSVKDELHELEVESENLAERAEALSDISHNWQTKFLEAKAANDELEGKVDNLTQVVLRAA